MAGVKLGHDARPYTFDGFVQKYGDAGRRLWVGAPPDIDVVTEWRFATDGQPYPWAEWCLAYDGQPYTWAEFVDNYGPSQGSTFWLDAHLVTSAPTLQDDRNANAAQLGGSQHV